MKYLFIITEWRKGSKQLSTIIFYILQVFFQCFNYSTLSLQQIHLQGCYNKFVNSVKNNQVMILFNLISPYHIIPGSGAGSHDWPWLHPVSHHPLLILPLQGQLRILSHLALILTPISSSFSFSCCRCSCCILYFFPRLLIRSCRPLVDARKNITSDIQPIRSLPPGSPPLADFSLFLNSHIFGPDLPGFT